MGLWFMVYGEFGNPGNCSRTDRFFVASDHVKYEKIYSTILAAYSAKKKIRAFIHNCVVVTWFSASDVTYNQLLAGGDFSIKD